MKPIALESLLLAQQAITEKISSACPLAEVLEQICRAIESALNYQSAKSSILLLDGTSLHHGAAPSLPEAYCRAIDGVEIGEKVGSCGTAAYRKEQVIVSDIASDPLWENYKSVALPHDLIACWSTPIISTRGEVLGTFAIYYTEKKLPDPEDLKLIDHFTGLSRIAIERENAIQREKALLNQLQTSSEKLRAFIEVIPDLGLILDETGTCVDVYGGGDETLSRQVTLYKGKPIEGLISTAEAPRLMKTMKRALENQKLELVEYSHTVNGETRVLEGRVCPLYHYLPEEPGKKHVLWIARDITEKRQAEQEIEKLAYFDPLTSLPNRQLFKNQLQNVIDAVAENSSYSALLFIDLDNFKRINDSLGHSVGDQLLVKIARVINAAMTTGVSLSRFGGDEFVVLQYAEEDSLNRARTAARNLARKLLDALSQSFDLAGGYYVVRASIGICLIYGSEMTESEILKYADSAMYKAKREGGNRYAFFDPELQHLADLQLKIERDIEAAIEKDQFVAHFQPQVNETGGLIGAEALVRWIHPEEGVIGPDKFIPVAEQTGAIHRIQESVLKQACDFINQAAGKGLIHPGFTMAVNISAIQFDNDRDLVSSLRNTVHDQGLSPDWFKLEITESLLMENVALITAKMTELRAQGFRFSIDDFGTGYSSLAYLHSFPVDELKIDRSFVDQIEEKGMAVIDAIISLSQSFGFGVVAEGVETAEQARLLIDRDVCAMQGYYFARPMDKDAFLTWAEKNTVGPVSSGY